MMNTETRCMVTFDESAGDASINIEAASTPRLNIRGAVTARHVFSQLNNRLRGVTDLGNATPCNADAMAIRTAADQQDNLRIPQPGAELLCEWLNRFESDMESGDSNSR